MFPLKLKYLYGKRPLDIVAAEANLHRQHIPIDPRCIMCGYYWVDTSHTLFYCKVIKDTWKKSDWWHIIKHLKGASHH